RVCRRVASITLRDQDSGLLLEEWGVPSTSYQITADPVFGLYSPISSGMTKENTGEKILSLNLRPYGGWEQDKNYWMNVCQTLITQGWQLRFVALGPGDVQLGREVQHHVP